MVHRKQIRQVAGRIAGQFRPMRIVLFGSYAYGRPTSGSDVDVLVVMRHRGPAYRLAARIRNCIDVGFPVDILVRSPAEIRRQLKVADPFMVEVMGKGEVLHEAGDAANGIGGRIAAVSGNAMYWDSWRRTRGVGRWSH